MLSPLKQINEQYFRMTWTITVTREEFEWYEEQCDAGNADFCNVGIPGFTPAGMANFLDYLNDLHAYIRELNNALDYWERVGDRIDAHYNKEETD